MQKFTRQEIRWMMQALEKEEEVLRAAAKDTNNPAAVELYKHHADNKRRMINKLKTALIEENRRLEILDY